MQVNHLLKAADTEVKNSFLESSVKVESNHLWILVDKQWFLMAGQLGSVGASDLISCKTLLKISSEKHPLPSACDASYVIQ